jgi:hypothetical protein
MQKLNFNLKNLIFSFLTTPDLTHVINISRNFHTYIHKYNPLVNNDSLKIFSFLYNLRNIKSSEKDHSKQYINHYRGVDLFFAVLKRFENINIIDIANGFVLYFNCHRLENGSNKIYLDFSNEHIEEILLLKKIVIQLDKEKFIYCLHFSVDFYSHSNIIVEILKNVRYIQYIDKNNSFLFDFLLKNEIEVFLNKFNGSNYELKSAEKYFKKFPNNVDKIESINLNNSDEDCGKEILVNNSQSIKKMKIKGNDLRILDTYFSEGLNNLKKIYLTDHEVIAFNSKFFQKIKCIRNINSVGLLTKKINLESLNIKNEKVSHILNFKDTLKKLRITYNKKFLFFDEFLKFENLKILEINFLGSEDKFYFDKFFKINCCNLWNDILSLFSVVLRNNKKNNLKNIFVECSKIDLLHELFDYLENGENNSLLHEIKRIKLTDTLKYQITKFRKKVYFENLNELEIDTSEYYPLLRYTKNLDRLIIKNSSNKHDVRILKEIIKLNLRLFYADFCDVDEFFKILRENLKSFKNLVYIHISNTNSTKYDYLEDIKSLNPFFLKIKYNDF